MVVAGKGVRREDTPLDRVTAIIGTGVVVLAGQAAKTRGTAPLAAYVSQRTGVGVTAGGRVWCMHAPLNDIAAIIRAGVSVVTFQCLASRAGPVLTCRVLGACVAVVAGQGIVGVRAPCRRFTSVICARITVFTG